MFRPSSGHQGGSPRGLGGRGHMFKGPRPKTKDRKATLLRLWDYLKEQKLLLSWVFMLVVLSSVFGLAGPLLIGQAIDNYIIPGDFKGLLLITIIMGVVYLLNALFSWLQSYILIGVAQKTVYKMRTDLFSKIQTLPVSFFDRNPHGELMSRLTNDLENVSNTLNTSITQIMASLLMVVGTISVMLWLSPTLTLVCVMIIPAILLTTKKIAGFTRKYFAEQQQALGELNGFIEENISGQRVVKVFAQEEKSIDQFAKYNGKLKKISQRAQVLAGLIHPLFNVLNNIIFALLVGVGGWLVLKELITIGIIASFINYLKQFFRPLSQLANQFNLLQSAIAGAERVFAVMDEKPEQDQPGNRTGPDRIRGEVALQHVSFGYQKETPVLKDINLRVKPGQTIALVGPTGAGKTTIVNLLTRFYEIDTGSILIDGQDIRSFSRNSLRSCLGIVLQDTYLFSDTVRENIRYGRLTATDQEVEAAARIANAEQFIKRLPQGYDTVLSDDGGNLSQGQRQLLTIARAVLADPAILILDEATSSVDTRTELQIQEAMLSLMQGRTSFVIAHRLSTIKNADLILVINDGEIIEQGSHQELLTRQGFYYELYNSQFTVNESA